VALKLRTSSSFRAVAATSQILHEYHVTSLEPVVPNTVWWWVRKIGYYRLTKPKSRAHDWIILLDESVKLGPCKLLVLLGIRESEIDFSRPLRYTDLEPLWISASSQWNGDFIRDLLIRLEGKLGHITYAVGDYGSDIKKGLREAGIPHIHDITHHIALLLQHLYEKDSAYHYVTTQFAQIRQRLQQTVAAPLLPPKPRAHSRYHDLQPLAAYGQHVLTYLRHASTATRSDALFREAMSWVTDYQEFFAELQEVTALVRGIERPVKHYGLSSATVTQCAQELPQATTEKGRRFKFDMLVYLHTTLDVTRVLEELVCTSDILESAFGKYKTYLSCNPMAGITDLALCIAAFTSSLELSELAEALEQTRHHDVTRWSRVFIGPTLSQQRRQAFSDDGIENLGSGN